MVKDILIKKKVLQMDELTTNVEIGKNGESRSGEGFLLSHF